LVIFDPLVTDGGILDYSWKDYLSRSEQQALRAAVEAYENLIKDGRALTAGRVRKRDELLQTMRDITDYGDLQSVVQHSRHMLGIRPVTAKASRRSSYKPGRRRPNWDFDATHVESIVPTPTETDRRRH